jgi:mannose-6-phosphate isomerase-like protein (cupin superfamily)
MNIRNFPPNFDEYWEHNHVDPPAADGEEEVYTALAGRATLHVAGEEYVLEPGVFARVAAAEKRKITAAAEGAQLLCIGATPGQVYEPMAIVELGGPASLQ